MSFGIIATLPALPIGKDFTHTLQVHSLAQAQIPAQAVEDLAHIEAAQQARKARRTASHRSIQKGGILYASEARNIAAVRVEDELAKAKALMDKVVKAEAKKQGGFT